MDRESAVMTITEVAAELKCSKSHVYNLVAGRVPNVSPLPHIRLGRKELIRRSALDKWTIENELNADATLGAEPGINTVDA